MKHNIYLIEPTSRADIGWDCYDGFVIIADNEKEARNFCPYADEGKKTWLYKTYSTIEKIGESDKEKGLYLASFNAG